MAAAVGLAATALNTYLGTIAPTSGASIGLHTAIPGAAGTTSASAGDSSKKSATFAAASGGSVAMSGTAGPWTNGGTSETISHISGWTASGATFQYSAALTASKSWASGDTFTLSSLTIAVTPVASS